MEFSGSVFHDDSSMKKTGKLEFERVAFTDNFRDEDLDLAVTDCFRIVSRYI